jgi:hypothetical protein
MPYDTRYGRKAGSLMSGEETVFLWEILRQGVKGRWVPGVPVLHTIPVERQTIAHLRKALTGVGLELGLRFPARSRLEFRGVPLWLWRDALTFEARFRLRRIARRSSNWHADLVVAAVAWGRIQWTLQNRRNDAAEASLLRKIQAPLV